MASFIDLICPRCKQVVAEGRANEEVVVCNHCGYTHNHRDIELEEKHERRLLAVTLIGAIIAIAGFIHFVQWDTYSFQIVPLKVKQWVNIATPQDLRQIADICRARMKYNCTENALGEIVKKNPTDLKTLFELADLQRQLGQLDAAAANFKNYFSQGGNDPNADFSYARVLASTGDYNNSRVYYQRTLLAKPGILQITVIQHYVAMLMKAKKMKAAIALINYVRNHSGPEGETFMAREYNQMTGRM